MAHMRVTPLSCFSLLFSIFCFFFQKCYFFFSLVFLSDMFHCWHWCQISTVEISSVVGAPWRCGVVTTKGGIAGIGLGHQHGREHDSTPQSGVEAPRLSKRSLPRLYYCCSFSGLCRVWVSWIWWVQWVWWVPFLILCPVPRPAAPRATDRGRRNSRLSKTFATLGCLLASFPPFLCPPPPSPSPLL